MITLDLSTEEARLLLNFEGGVSTNDLFSRVIDLNGLKVVPVHLEEYSDYNMCDPWFSKYQHESFLRVKIELEPVRTVKSKEQILAEESVEKAKAALQASQDVLNKLKEK